MSQYYYNPFGNNQDNNDYVRTQFLRQQQEKKEKKEIRTISFSMGCAIIAYLVIQVASLSFMKLVGWDKLYTESPAFQYAFTIFFVSFLSVLVPFAIVALVNKKRYDRTVIPAQKVGFFKGFCWVSFGMAGCSLANMAVSYMAGIIQEIIGHELYSGIDIEPDSVTALVMEFIGMAVVPAICEELAMRCFSLQLLAKYGKGFGVFAVSLVFGLLHGNIVQFVFAFAVGLILGFITIKTNNISIAILIHAFNNGISAVQSAVQFVSDKETASNALLIMYIGWLLVGMISFLFLLFKKEFSRSQPENKSVLTTGQKISSFIFPWMIIPLIELVSITISTFFLDV